MKVFAIFFLFAFSLCAQEPAAPADSPFGVSVERARRNALKKAKQGGVKDPVLLKSVPVTLPPDAKPPAVGGKVEVAIYVKADGTVHHADITSSSHPMFNAPVIHSVMQQRYEPATKDGKPVEFQLTMMVIIPPPKDAPSKDSKKG